jgi:hypothetical protein
VIIVRGDQRPGWTALSNDMLEHGELSFKARGLLGYLLSRPADWETDSERLAKSAHARRDGRDAIRTGLAELEAEGYLVRVRTQDRATGHWSTASYVYEHPLPPHLRSTRRVKTPVDNPVDELGITEPPTTAFPTVGKSGAINNTQEQEEIKTPGDHTGAVDSSAAGGLGRPSGLGKAALASGSPSAAAAGAAGGRPTGSDAEFELPLSPADAAALREVATLVPRLSTFALRAHLGAAFGVVDLDFVDVLDAVRIARARSSPAERSALTIQRVIEVAMANRWRPRRRGELHAGD